MKTALLATALLAAAPGFADSLTSTSLKGVYTSQGPQTVCQGTSTCTASTVIPAEDGYSIQAGIDSTASFTTTANGSYFLNSTLSAYQGNSYGASQLYPNPETSLNALFNIPLNSGSWEVQLFFFESGDAYNPAANDSATVQYGSMQYQVRNTCALSPFTNQDNCGSTSASYLITHTPGIMQQIAFNTSAFSNDWGTDTVQFEAILTDPGSPTPEPGSVYLILGGSALIAGRKVWSMRRAA